MMALWLILVLAVSLRAQIDASQVSFAKRNGKIYVETDPKHYCLYGQVTDKAGVRIISIDVEGQHHLTSECDHDWMDYKEIGARTLQKYDQLRTLYMGSKGDSKETPKNYVWTESFTEGEKIEEQPVARKIDDNTFIYASKYFPKFLARVIISGNVVIYVKYDGKVRMKTMKCLDLYETIFIEGIKKISRDEQVGCCFHLLSSKPDKVLKKHLMSKNFDALSFKLETDYWKTYTDAELIAIQNGIRRAGVRVFDGWGP